MEKEIKWFKTPKALFISKEYHNLKDGSTRLLNHLLYLHNSFKRQPFYQYMDDLAIYTGMSKKRIRSAKADLEKNGFNIGAKRKGNIWCYDLNEIYKKYIALKNM